MLRIPRRERQGWQQLELIGKPRLQKQEARLAARRLRDRARKDSCQERASLQSQSEQQTSAARNLCVSANKVRTQSIRVQETPADRYQRLSANRERSHSRKSKRFVLIGTTV
uniref:Uncharacterized protein n=1 Tax=Amphimedon queenslandica TaxID=400682 RepID=A0A1X7U4Q2_AMPQE